MSARVCIYVIFFMFNILLIHCVTVDTEHELPYPISKSRVELAPLHISGGLNDIIIISTPIIDRSTVYYLSRPDGETIPLNITINSDSYKNVLTQFEDIIIKFVKSGIKSVISFENKYRIFNVNFGTKCSDTVDIYADEVKDLMPNEFLIGPISESDHGNWVLSAYVRTSRGMWVEVFQYITIKIIENIPSVPTEPNLNPGDTFELSFAYPIRYLETCEITAPRSTFDRFYDMSKIKMESCGYIISNVTKADQGLWRIIGVGKIVYESVVYLRINDMV